MFSYLQDLWFSYPEHLKFSLYLSYSFAKASFFAFLHALFPFLFITHSTDNIKYLNEIIKKTDIKIEYKNN
tara:strand:+ start:319 stop:531 length:213 start_codon:yes stop_codon:yes gene_type:complete